MRSTTARREGADPLPALLPSIAMQTHNRRQRRNRDRESTMSSPFATHDVLNQSPPFEDLNLFSSDRALLEAVNREGGGSAVERLRAFGQACGSAAAFERGRLANEN